MQRRAPPHGAASWLTPCGFLRARRALTYSHHCAQETPSRPPKGGSPARALGKQGRRQERAGLRGLTPRGGPSPRSSATRPLSPARSCFCAPASPARFPPQNFSFQGKTTAELFPPPVPLKGDAPPACAPMTRAWLRHRVRCWRKGALAVRALSRLAVPPRVMGHPLSRLPPLRGGHAAPASRAGVAGFPRARPHCRQVLRVLAPSGHVRCRVRVPWTLQHAHQPARLAPFRASAPPSVACPACAPLAHTLPTPIFGCPEKSCISFLFFPVSANGGNSFVPAPIPTHQLRLLL